VVSRSSTGYPRGTEILVEDLFYNVPARRKFLRTERTERRHIDAFITRYAIAYPNVAFQVRHEERESLRTPGNGDPQEGLIEVYGVDLGSSLLPIAPELTEGQAVRVRGYVGPTSVHRANRGYITLMINGRWVEDLRISYAIIQAYHTLLPTKRYPVAFVMVEMPSEEVDVNVHPAKTEVRFRDGDAIFRAVQRAVRATVVNEAPTTTSWEPATGAPSPATRPSTRSRLAKLQPARQFSLPEAPAGQPASEREGGPVATTTASGGDNGQHLPPLRVVGQVASTFIIAEGPQGLYLIDQHAAHERVLYEQLLGEWATGQVPAQPLLEPQAVALPPAEAAQLEEQLPKLTELGLEVEPFGPNTFLVRTLPAPLGALEPGDLLADIATAEIEDSPIREGLEELTIRKICKRAAVKAGQVLNHEEMEGLIKALEKTRNPRTCPHGRPTILEISVEQLAAQFERR
jgi:DNA mismatch repair protein MutL